MKTVWLEIDDRGEIVWHPVFLDFDRYWGFTPRLCRPEVADQRIHGTTHEQVSARWDADRFSLQPLDGRPPYPYVDEELRKVARDLSQPRRRLDPPTRKCVEHAIRLDTCPFL